LLPTEEWKEEKILLKPSKTGFEIAEIDDWSFLKHRDIFWKEQEV
jgi:hypothetical protein